jgi:protein dithiol oxidoreductase (disulfide-forming)
MSRSLVSILLFTLSIAACAREPATGPASASQAAAPAAGAATPTTQATPSEPTEIQQATAAQETGGDAAEERSDSSLIKLAALPADQQLPAGRWTPGQSYQVISPPQPTYASAGQVEVLEMFAYGCPHCAALEPYIVGWLKNKPSYVKFEQIPAWGADEARLFYTIETLGRSDLHVKVFKTIHPQPGVKRYDMIFAPGDETRTLELQHKFAEANGISAAKFDEARQSFTTLKNVKSVEERLRRYSDFYEVGTVPSVVVNGKYVTDVGRAGGNQAALIQLITDLTAAEKPR